MSAARSADLRPFVGAWVSVECDDGSAAFSATGWLRATAPGSALPFAVHDAMGGIFALDPSTVVTVGITATAPPAGARPPPAAARAPSPESRAISPEQILAATAAQHAASEAQRLALLEATNAANAAARDREASAESQREQLRVATLSAASAAAERDTNARTREAAAEAQRMQLHAQGEALHNAMNEIRQQFASQQQQHQQQQQLVLSALERLSQQRPSGTSPVPGGDGSPLPRREGPMAPPPSFTPSPTPSDASVAAILARDEERVLASGPLWCSHTIPTRAGLDIFTSAQRNVLLSLPCLSLLRAEADFDETRLTIRHLADAAIALQPHRSIEAIESHLLALMRRGGRDEAAVTPERFLSLRSAMNLLNSTARCQALFDLAIFALRVQPAYAKNGARLDRIVIASLSVQPGSCKQVTRWTSKSLAAGQLPAEAEIPLVVASVLPVRVAGPQIF